MVNKRIEFKNQEKLKEYLKYLHARHGADKNIIDNNSHLIEECLQLVTDDKFWSFYNDHQIAKCRDLVKERATKHKESLSVAAEVVVGILRKSSIVKSAERTELEQKKGILLKTINDLTINNQHINPNTNHYKNSAILLSNVLDMMEFYNTIKEKYPFEIWSFCKSNSYHYYYLKDFIYQKIFMDKWADLGSLQKKDICRHLLNDGAGRYIFSMSFNYPFSKISEELQGIYDQEIKKSKLIKEVDSTKTKFFSRFMILYEWVCNKSNQPRIEAIVDMQKEKTISVENEDFIIKKHRNDDTFRAFSKEGKKTNPNPIVFRVSSEIDGLGQLPPKKKESLKNLFIKMNRKIDRNRPSGNALRQQMKNWRSVLFTE